MADYVIRRGETLVLPLNVVEGDVSLVSIATAKMKKAGTRNTVPGPDAPVIMTLTTEINGLNGWYFSLTDDQTETLQPDTYIVDAKLTFNDGSVIKTNPVTIEVKPSVT
jgi:hypothetical protein